ncbi:hypothetical protein K7432_013654 [Basidiobolus ranarum]|uniref:Uncharacterized protein n=1 Tax=Basidiobolus ranarum TaxID=34480 RepID=A0ABR2WIX0_9FUNG
MRIYTLVALLTYFSVFNEAALVTSTDVNRNTDSNEAYIIELEHFHGDPDENLRKQENFLASLEAVGIQYDKRVSFSSFFNALSLNIPSKHLDLLHKLPQVKAIWPVLIHQQQAPIPSKLQHGLPSNLIANIHAATSVDKVHSQLNNTGSGIKVGIIDTGIDYNHPALGGCFGPKCRVRYGWDFLGDNFNEENPKLMPDSDPMDCNGHGTHVAGIVAAKDKEFVGVAPDAILGAYRALNCEGQGPTDAIIQAVEMAIKDKMDIINLSLGSNVPFADGLKARILNHATSLGIIVVSAAGNEGENGLWTINSPSTGSDIISVASFESPSYLGGKAVLDQFPKQEIVVIHDGRWKLSFSKTPIIDIETISDYSKINGKIVFLNLNTTIDPTQYPSLTEAGAVGIITISNTTEPDVPDSTSVEVPLMSVDAKSATFIFSKISKGKRITVSILGENHLHPNPYANKPSSFSSWGPDYELNVKPDIGAPGGNIYSTYPLASGGYVYMKGTSMATPYLAGSSALILKARKDAQIDSSVDVVRGVIISSGVPASSENQTTPYAPVGKQGAGLINVWNAIHTNTLVSPQKIALNDTIRENLNHVLTITNTGSKSIVYNFTHHSALSVNDYNSNGIPLLAQNFLSSKESAQVSFDPQQITLEPGKSSEVTLQFVPPTFNDTSPWIYSGYIFVSGSDDIPPKVIPYIGAAGDMGTRKAINTSGPYAPRLIYDGPHPQTANSSMVFNFKNDTAIVNILLVNPTKHLTVYVADEQKDMIGRLSLQPNVGRSLTELETLNFTGSVILEQEGIQQVVAVPDGKYHIVVETQTWFNNTESDKWVSPLFEIIKS